MLQVKLREKGQITIPIDILQEWREKNHVQTNDAVQITLSNGVLMLIPANRGHDKRDLLSFAGSGKGLWGSSEQAIEDNISALRNSWAR